MTPSRRSFVLATAGALLATQSTLASAEPIVLLNFKKVAALQRTPVWCWAAVIQMLLNNKGVDWSQEDVVLAVKGRIAFETASQQQISAFLNNWGFDHAGRPWRARSVYAPRPPTAAVAVEELRDGRPMILKFQAGGGMEHVVVAYGANVLDRPNEQQYLHGVFIFDPWDGQISMLPGAEFFKRISGHWLVDISA